MAAASPAAAAGAAEPPGALRANTHKEFVGVAQLKAQQAKTLREFEAAAASGRWSRIHEAHYDWWMFPVDAPSGHAFAYTVFEFERAALKADPEWVKSYLQGVRLLARAWAWDVDARKEIPARERQRGQGWSDWPIRLYKCTVSLQLFGFDTEAESMRQYARLLMGRGVRMSYGGRDLSDAFK